MKKALLLSLLPILVHIAEAQIRIDHVIILVPDLEQASEAYSVMGFALKEGRLHENGLLNAHIKFANRSALELMTVKGEATDAMARQYQELLPQGGGVYLAMTGHHHDSLKIKLMTLDIEFIETNGKLWSYLSFPSESFLAHVFFIDYHFDIGRLNDPTDHTNGITGIKEVAIEGGEAVVDFFKEIGLPQTESTTAFVTQTGLIGVVPSKNLNRPRLVSISLEGEDTTGLEISWRK